MCVGVCLILCFSVAVFTNVLPVSSKGGGRRTTHLRACSIQIVVSCLVYGWVSRLLPSSFRVRFQIYWFSIYVSIFVRNSFVDMYSRTDGGGLHFCQGTKEYV